MSIRLYTSLKQVLQFYRLLMPVVAIVTIAVLMAVLNGQVSTFILLLTLLIVLGPMVMTAFFPVSCRRVGCRGHMDITSKRLSFWTVGLVFTCECCSEVHATKIFNPDVEVSIEVSF